MQLPTRAIKAKEDKQRKQNRCWTADDAHKVLADWQRSGLSIPDFCRQHSLDPKRIYWWRKRLSEWQEVPQKKTTVNSEIKPRMVEAQVKATAKVADAVLAFHFCSGVKIEVHSPKEVQARWLLQVAKGLSKN